MTVKNKVKSHPGVAGYLKKLPFYNRHIENPKIKRVKNIHLLSELSFYEQLKILKANNAFRGDTLNYNVKFAQKKMQLHN